MSSFKKIAFRFFGEFSERFSFYFAETKLDLKRARMKYSIQEYLSIAIMICFIAFIIQLPLLSFLFGIMFQNFLFGFISSITFSLAIITAILFVFLSYPKLIVHDKARELENSLPYAALYLSTVAGSRLPLHKTFEIFSRFSGYGEITKEINLINEDIRAFGLDIYTALERAIDRTGSKVFKDFLWGIYSTLRSGGDLAVYLKQKSANLMAEHRRNLYEFSHSLTVYIEVYLTAIVVGAIFFTILTAIISGISKVPGNIIVLQFFMIFVFLPLISVLFMFLVKSMTPGGE